MLNVLISTKKNWLHYTCCLFRAVNSESVVM